MLILDNRSSKTFVTTSTRDLEEYKKCLVELNSIVKEAWTTSQQTQDRREKVQAAKECYAMKQDLLTNATIVDDIRGNNILSNQVGG